MLSGQNITEVATTLSVDRGTLYNWLDKLTFKAYYNRLCDEIKQHTQNSLIGLYNESLQAIRESLNSNNESIKLKTAFWLLERLDGIQIGQTDPKEMIKAYCTEDPFNHFNFTESFDELKFKKLCTEFRLL